MDVEYEAFVNSIKIVVYDKDEFYSEIVKYKDQILISVAKDGQQKTAESLRMSQPKLSAILNILKVL